MTWQVPPRSIPRPRGHGLVPPTTRISNSSTSGVNSPQRAGCPCSGSCQSAGFSRSRSSRARADRFPSQSGIGDIRAGAKLAMLSTDEQSLTAQAQFFMPTGDAAKALGTDHASFEPELLYMRQLSGIATLESQFGVWIPFGGSAGVPTSVDENFSGSVLNYGIGSGIELLRRSRFTLGPVVELVGWHVLGGFQTAAVSEADGINIVNLKIGARTVIADRHSVYVGWGHHLTDETWYDDIVRFEYRHSF